MTTQESKNLIRRYFEELSGKEKPRPVLEKYVSSDGLIEHVLMMEEAFPRYELELHETVAEGDRVAVRMTFRGIHQGDFQGIPATGRDATMDIVAFYRIEEGKIAEASVQADGWSLVEQLTEE
jgi:predicted ester cyclase